MIEVRDLVKTFMGRASKVTALDGIDLSLEPGDIVGLLGPNGAGKTTAVKCLCTLVRPTSGTVLVGGVDVLTHPRQAVKNVAAVLEGTRHLHWRLTVRENLDFFAGLHGHRRRAVRVHNWELIERFRLADKADTPVRKLSKGMQQKLAVACALARQTPVLLLDEPTLGLDVEASHEFRAHLRELASADRSILVTSHDMDVIQDVCRRVVILNHGRVVVDDSVTRLLGLFSAQAYRFAIQGGLSTRQQDALGASFPLLTMSSGYEGSVVVDVELNHGAGIYQLVDILRSEGSVIRSIERMEPNLEQIFLKLVRKEH